MHNMYAETSVDVFVTIYCVCC